MTTTAVRRLAAGGALAAAVGWFAATPDAAAQPLPAGSPLRYVPGDAAAFVHADVAALWDGQFGKAARDALQKEGVPDPVAKTKAEFGVGLDQLKTVTAFWPKLAGQPDLMRVGVVLTFKTPYDAAAMEAGLAKVFNEEVPYQFKAPTDTTAVLLFGSLGGRYFTPRAAADAAPLAAYLREAAAGGAVLAGGITPANLPPELRDDNLPPDAEPFKPLFRAEAMAAFVTVGKELAFDVKVRSATPAKAADAQKALTTLLALGRGALDKIPADPKTDAPVRNLMTLLAALKDGLKATTFTTTGSETRGKLAVPAHLPFAAAAAEAVGKTKEAASRVKSFNNLKFMALALHNYAEINNGSFPPAAVVDKAGRPLLSWRVLVLPFVEQQQLFQQFKLDEPWDGPTNKKLIAKMPTVYELPPGLGSKAKAGETHYQAFVGKGAAFDLIRGARMPADFQDGTSNTLVVATAAVPVPWTKPADIAFDPAADMTTALGFFPTVCHAALGDGSVRTIRRAVNPKSLAAAITRAGGEVLDWNDF